MGIQGLLPLFGSVTVKTHLSQYAGLRMAVDAYVWLHRGAYTCSYELCQGICTHKYLDYCMKKVNMLRHFNITPILVFDGGSLPCKRVTEVHRQEKRLENHQKALQYLKQGNMKVAVEYFQRAVDITPRMAFNLIELLRKEGVEFIVAPYEADAQLAFLSINHLVDVIISEDSDLIPYGCNKILYKLDHHGWGQEIQLARLPQTKELDLSGFTLDRLRYMCILSGCDYLQSVPGMGLKTAYNLLKKHKNINHALRDLSTSRNNVPPDYEMLFKMADITFRHQVVYDPVSKSAVRLRPLPTTCNTTDLSFAGDLIETEMMINIAMGRVDPHTMQPFLLTLNSVPTTSNHLESTSNLANSLQKNVQERERERKEVQEAKVSKDSSLKIYGAQLVPVVLNSSQVATHNNRMTQDARQYAKILISNSASGDGLTKHQLGESPSKRSKTMWSYFSKVNTITNSDRFQEGEGGDGSNSTVNEIAKKSQSLNSYEEEGFNSIDEIMPKKIQSLSSNGSNVGKDRLNNVSTPSKTHQSLILKSKYFAKSESTNLSPIKRIESTNWMPKTTRLTISNPWRQLRNKVPIAQPFKDLNPSSTPFGCALLKDQSSMDTLIVNEVPTASTRIEYNLIRPNPTLIDYNSTNPIIIGSNPTNLTPIESNPTKSIPSLHPPSPLLSTPSLFDPMLHDSIAYPSNTTQSWSPSTQLFDPCDDLTHLSTNEHSTSLFDWSKDLPSNNIVVEVQTSPTCSPLPISNLMPKMESLRVDKENQRRMASKIDFSIYALKSPLSSRSPSNPATTLMDIINDPYHIISRDEPNEEIEKNKDSENNEKREKSTFSNLDSFYNFDIDSQLDLIPDSQEEGIGVIDLIENI